ncbi:MAG: hypothetical protein KDF60_16465 [Calditrichaeota bacterium]|nr:hypothetical protein [Calditrichota bacterium]
MKKFFIILGIALVVIIIGGGIYIYMNRENLANMAIEQAFSGIEQVTLNNLPADYNTDDIKKLINDAKLKIQDQGFESPGLQKLMTTFQQAYEDQKIDSTEVQKLVDDLKAIVE